MSWKKEKAPYRTSDGRVLGINGGAANSIRPAFWGEGNGLVTSGIKANTDPTPMSRQPPQRKGLGRGLIYDEGVTGLDGENVTEKRKDPISDQ